MDKASAQARIDAVTWYHEFDFGNGLKAQCKIKMADALRNLWAFLAEQLDTVDFKGKSVLDIGCWDGYWSFYAERRGAKHVLATDDRTQNWAEVTGVHLAKELLGSSVEIDLDVPIYDLTRLNRKFDIILCLGVYYHLFDPFYAFSQIRHCCHENTLVLIDGPEGLLLHPSTALFQFRRRQCEWLPTPEALDQILQASYLKLNHRATFLGGPAPVVTAEIQPPPLPPPQVRIGWRWRLRMLAQTLLGSRAGIKDLYHLIEAPPAPTPPPVPLTLNELTNNRRVFLKCTPLDAENEIYAYRPPFGLHQYDPRFRDASISRAA